MKVKDRLNGIAGILTESNDRLDSREYRQAGFLPLHPLSFLELASAVATLASGEEVSFDLMCGNGGWALMTSAMGHPSFGIDINHALVEEARANHQKAVEKGFIDGDVPCEFVAGNIYSGKGYEKYLAVSNEGGGSSGDGVPALSEDPYRDLGFNISDAGIIYAFAWSPGLALLSHFLDQEARQDTLFALPRFDGSANGIALTEASAIAGPYQIWKRK